MQETELSFVFQIVRTTFLSENIRSDALPGTRKNLFTKLCGQEKFYRKFMKQYMTYVSDNITEI